MDLFMLGNNISFACALIGFIYGIVKFFKSRKAVFAQMAALAVGCTMFGRLYQIIRILTQDDIFNEFQLGIFGIIGSLLFLFSANLGAIDSLIDVSKKQLNTVRAASIPGPLAILAIYVLFILTSDFSLLQKIMGAVVCVFAMEAAYISLKHLIVPDIENGVIYCLRKHNLLVLIYSFLCVADYITLIFKNGVISLVVNILIGIVMLMIPMVVERAVKKWTI